MPPHLTFKQIQFNESHGGGSNDNLNNHRPVKAVRDTFLSDLEPGLWKLGLKDLETIFNNYYYNEFEGQQLLLMVHGDGGHQGQGGAMERKRVIFCIFGCQYCQPWAN